MRQAAGTSGTLVIAMLTAAGSSSAAQKPPAVSEVKDGPYSDFIDTGEPIQEAVRDSLERRVRDDGEKVKVTADRTESGGIRAAVKTADGEPKQFGGQLGFLSHGPRYSGDAVVNGEMWWATGYGFRLNAHGAKGMAMHDEATGGDYESLGVTASRTEAYGTYLFSVNRSEYVQGGPFQPFELEGAITKLRAESQIRGADLGSWLFSDPLSSDIARLASAKAGAMYTHQSIDMERYSWTDASRYSQVYTGGTVALLPKNESQSGNITTEIAFGLPGTRDTDGQSILGSYDESSFWRGQAEVAWGGDIPGTLGLTYRAQYAISATEENAPSDVYAHIGGSDRGSAHLPGYRSGPVGQTYQAQVMGPPVKGKNAGFRPFLEINGGLVSQVNGGAKQVNAGEAGLKIGLGKQGQAELAYAKSFASDGEQRDRINGRFSLGF